MGVDGVPGRPRVADRGRDLVPPVVEQIFSAWSDGSGDTSLFAPTSTDDSAPAVAPNGDIAFTRVGGSGPPGIYIWDFNTLTFFVTGTGAAWSPDGTRLAYVQSSNLYVKSLPEP